MPYKALQTKKENDRRLYQNNRERVLAYRAAYDAAHREERRNYHAAHREEWRVGDAIRSARRLGLPATLTLEEWLSILDTYGHKCAYCGEPYEEIDHVIPLCRGGGTVKENVVPTCRPCNIRKGAKPAIVVPAVRLML